MAISHPLRKRIKSLREEYASLKSGNESLLTLLDEAEMPESVYNSNAIENSTLTLKETEKILLGMKLSRNVSVREIINMQLLELEFPRITIRNKEKATYYQAFRDYNDRQETKTVERILTLGLLESLHKRTTYLRGEKIIRLADYIRQSKLSAPSVTNAARRQTIPAFREKEVWKIGQNYERA